MRKKKKLIKTGKNTHNFNDEEISVLVGRQWEVKVQQQLNSVQHHVHLLCTLTEKSCDHEVSPP